MLRRFEFPRDPSAPAEARRAVDELRPAVKGDGLDDARLLVSELVTNSVRHGDGESVTILFDAGQSGRLRCEVIDDGEGFVPRARDAGSIGGWGLDLVEQIATSWGVREGSTHVWFELPTDASERR